MQEVKNGKAVIRLHGVPDAGAIKGATVEYMKRLIESERKRIDK